MTRAYDCLIVGGGHGGAQAAVALRHARFDGSIAIVGEEPELPYDRPPLSKEYLAGEKPWERLVFRTAEAWAERQVDLVSGTRVVSIDHSARQVRTHSGETIGYGRLIWATGGSPRRLGCAGGDLAGVHTIRTRAEVDKIRAELPRVVHVVVIGGGYIGLEAAAILSKLGKQVTVVETLDRVLARVAGEPLSRFYEAEHRSHGVELVLGGKVESIVGANGHASGVRLADGTVLPAELVIVGIGIIPAVEPLLEAGAQGGNGVRVDGQCRTSLPDIYAIGDCAEHRNVHAGDAWLRLESVQNANDQATIAAKAIMGGSDSYSAIPWFWSNQYDLRLQTIGVSAGHDRIVVRGEPAARSFSVVYLRQGRVVALDCVNAVRDYAQGKGLIAAGRPVDAGRLADASVPLKTLLG